MEELPFRDIDIISRAFDTTQFALNTLNLISVFPIV
jgi:hypothetical protein